ncbi:collagen alpha-1(X) chain-like [Gadus chalcogrammus]|uniref:collagen alpha-1(X) chain-like n=1 Tax=Gadus chalcogrammus TaxID=1042646 RepID=UPI0024C4ADC9|nr:collagen alpha-1(X) chain-like [Gadus chalcogrammus]
MTFCRLLLGLLLSCVCTANHVHTATTVKTTTIAQNETDIQNATTPVTPPEPVHAQQHTYGSDPNTFSTYGSDPTTTSSDDLPYFQDDYELAMGNNTGNNRLRSGGVEGMEYGPAGDICDSTLPGAEVPWMCYCRFCKGGQGPKGDQGFRGLPGSPGSPGRRGLTGFRGRPGYTGQPGLKGQKGDDGEKGDVGPAGMYGSKGGRGFKGDKGDVGFVGPQGVMGPPGEDGTCPASCDSVEGPPGHPGLPGSAGGRGLPGLMGPRGPMGPGGLKGDLGMNGADGSDGMKGIKGEEGLCDCSDGEQGPPGPQGPNGTKGEGGVNGAPGPEGETGPQGSEGPMGYTGAPGPCSPAIQSAFSAALLTSYPPHLRPVSFPRVHHNQGNFNPIMGIYRAPVNGTYVFSYNLAVRGKPLMVGLYHNFRPIVRTRVTNNPGVASQQVVLHMSRADEVWLLVKDMASNGMIADNENSSTFAGFLLNPDNCMPPPMMGRDGGSVGNEETATAVYSWGSLATEPSPTTP